VLRAKLKGDVASIGPGRRVIIDGQDFAVTSANIAYNIENHNDSTSDIEGEHFLTSPEPLTILAQWRNQEDIYRDDQAHEGLITDISAEIKEYFAKHPEKLRDLDPRKFEELIADILTDLGWDTELTCATRDGGRDIYAYLRNQVTSFLMFVECKRWSEDKKVGIDIVQRLYGVARADSAHKSMIVTTSFFTLPAQQWPNKIAGQMELKDYNDLKAWLSRYK
jgi:restriction endonuclease Mrr